MRNLCATYLNSDARCNVKREKHKCLSHSTQYLFGDGLPSSINMDLDREMVTRESDNIMTDWHEYRYMRSEKGNKTKMSYECKESDVDSKRFIYSKRKTPQHSDNYDDDRA